MNTMIKCFTSTYVILLRGGPGWMVEKFSCFSNKECAVTSHSMTTVYTLIPISNSDTIVGTMFTATAYTRR